VIVPVHRHPASISLPYPQDSYFPILCTWNRDLPMVRGSGIKTH
jgi:hypothetical protein